MIVEKLEHKQTSHNVVESLDKENFLILFNLVKLNKNKIKNGIHYDLDQILSISEEPVKKAFDKAVGTNYCQYPIDRWYALATRAHNDGVMPFEEARELEDRLWVDPDTLILSEPNRLIRSYSRRAHELGIKQTVTTSRLHTLRDCTFAWMEKHFPWIQKENIAIQPQDYPYGGDIFKASRIKEINPYAHFEDAVKAVQAIRLLGLATPVIWFPRETEKGSFANDPKLLEFDMATFFGMFSENGIR